MGKQGCVIVEEDIEEGEISDDEQQSMMMIKETKKKKKKKEDSSKREVASAAAAKVVVEDSRVWKMEDLMKYSRVSSNYGSGLYNFAWAQAVQNKPLNFGSNNNNKNKSLNSDCNAVIDVVSDDDDDEEEEETTTATGTGMEDDEKEEGELEEGEIDLDGEMVVVVEETEEDQTTGGGDDVQHFPQDDEDEFRKQIKSIGDDLESLTADNADKSFRSSCSKLQSTMDTLDNLCQTSLEHGVISITALIRQSFAGVQALHSMFCSMSSRQEEDKDVFSRLLAHVKSHSALFSRDQLKEVEGMISSLDTIIISCNAEATNINEEIQGTNGVNRSQLGTMDEIPASSSANSMHNHEELQGNTAAKGSQLGVLSDDTGQIMDSSKKLPLEPISVKSGDQSSANIGSETLKFGPSPGFRGRGNFGPLLDLHRDHDIDSLPSPTREAPTPLPVQKLQVVECRANKPELTNSRVAERSEAHPLYETDALKAVSTYQQKFGRTSFLPSTRLPSPTPSGESNDGDDDSKGEVSSSAVCNVGTVNSSIPQRAVGSAISHNVGLSRQGISPARTVNKLESVFNAASRPKSNSRDPRLRVANSGVTTTLVENQSSQLMDSTVPKNDSLGGITNSRKHHTVTEPALDGHHTVKRQRTGLTDPRISGDKQILSKSGGWLQESTTAPTQTTPRNQLAENVGADFRKVENGVVSSIRQDVNGFNSNARAGGSELIPVNGAGVTSPFPSLLKDIAVNPTMLMNLIMEQMRLAAESQQKSSNPTQNMTTGSVLGGSSGAIPLATVTSSNSSGAEQTHAVTTQIPTQPLSTGEFGKIRMKPGDPRRVLHDSSFQNNETMGSEKLRTIGAPLLTNSDSVVVRQQGRLAQGTYLPSDSAPAPDISQQFTKGLKNVADILSASQSACNLSTVSQTVFSQTSSSKMDTADMRSLDTETREQQSGTSCAPDEDMVGSSGSQNKWEDVEHLFEGYDDQQRAAIHKERSRRIDEQNKMFASRKLCLVLDLDHTLLNSAKFIEVDPVHNDILRRQEEQDREMPYRHLFRFAHMGMWTKLRPGVWNFLEKASKLFELHLYTMGNKLYATEMAKVLDPTGALFAGRVISKGDDGDPFDGDDRVPKSKDLEGVLGMESCVLIIDDSVRVWPHNKLNLIVVERYIYFPCSRRQFGLPGLSLLERDVDERAEDGTLASSLAVIERIHQNFFSHKSLHDVDVRNILASEQRKILGGCRILFSRVIPVGVANPHLHPLWQTAEQFGAVCTNQIDEQVTHVVAHSLGTDKVNWALATGRFVVYPGWVEASALLYRRANELDFAIKP